MSVLTKPVVGTGLASCCSIFSITGVLFLCVIGLAFDNNVEVLMGSTKSPENGAAVARTCYGAAIVYACFVGFCGMQIGLNKRYQRGAVRL